MKSLRRMLNVVAVSCGAAVLPVAMASAATSSTSQGITPYYLYTCGYVGSYSSCGNPSYVASMLISDVEQSTADMVLNQSAYNNWLAANGYADTLNALQTNLTGITLTSDQSNLVNTVFPSELNEFRAADVSPLQAKAEETAIWDPTSYWAGLTSASQLVAGDFINELTSGSLADLEGSGDAVAGD